MVNLPFKLSIRIHSGGVTGDYHSCLRIELASARFLVFLQNWDVPIYIRDSTTSEVNLNQDLSALKLSLTCSLTQQT